MASGSSGNTTLVRSGGTSVLIDLGVSTRRLNALLSEVGVPPQSIDAVLLSHGHSDHTCGLVPFARKRGLAVFASRATFGEVGSISELCSENVHYFESDVAFQLGDLRITPFPVPHDSADPAGFTIEDSRARVGFATDLGSESAAVLGGLAGCDCLVLESNHDEDMLVKGPYPPFLKRRVNGPLGHLSNRHAARLLRQLGHDGLRYLVLAHLSRTNNHPALALRAAERALGDMSGKVDLSLGHHDRPGRVMEL